MPRKWTKIPDGGWLQDQPSYESGNWVVARDYDDLDTESQKTMWFLHHIDKGFMGAFETLREAKEHVGDTD